MRIQRQEVEVRRTTNVNVESNNTTSTLRAAEHAPPSYDGSKESVWYDHIEYFLLLTEKQTLKVHESPPPYSDTGHEVLSDIGMINRNTSSQIGGTSHSNEIPTISIISNGCPERGVINENNSQSDNKEDKSNHM